MRGILSSGAAAVLFVVGTTGLGAPDHLTSAAMAQWTGVEASAHRAATVYFSDNFEAGSAGWVLDGSWGLTTSTSRGGTHSLTDSPAGDYAPNSVTSATLATPLNLSGATAPVLRFWHKGRTHGYDQAAVQFSTDGGTNWDELRYFTAEGWFQDGWMLEQVELPKSDNLVIRFKLFTNGDASVTDGWYVDDVWIGEKDTARLSVPFHDNFEAGLANWIVSGHDWGLTAPVALSLGPSLTDSPLGDYSPYAAASATLAHPLDLRGAAAPVLEFWHQGRTHGYDWAGVEFSTDGGTNWGELRYFSSGGWFQDGWMLEQIELPKSDNVVIRFQLFSNGDAAVDDGWYVDEVRIVSAYLAGIGDDVRPVLSLGLDQNHPNPFSRLTTIGYRLPGVSRVSLRIFDLSGRLVRVLDEGQQAGGDHSVQWDARDGAGKSVAAGLYFCRLEVGARQMTRRLMLLP